METIYQGVVVKKIEYEEYDEIVTIQTLTKKVTFIAKGTRKLTSKNRSRLQILNTVECEIFEARLANKISKLKRAEIIQEFNPKTDINVINNLIQIFEQLPDNSYNFVNTYMKLIANFGYGNDYIYFVFLLAKLLDSLGINPKYDGCVECGTKNNIVDFEFWKGGFYCANHSTKKKPDSYLTSIYFLSQKPIDFFNNIDFSFLQQIYKELWEYIKQNSYLQ
ncbi:DNA repair protein RecO [[Mycoplasma] gypis]|uniref:DNA repair protein RecO n=1 Tax=[Mycoplasma] gypis TaxID=92404 RepID=A0ABZ2RNI9_9BACT|nr:DNA repair protein RecO [[Mycoplasma] gypis]MBN0919548.1 DNA repair protein RecO [[Mycoplasma] gypis]